VAIGTPVSIGTTQNKTAESATVLTTSAAVPAGALIVVCYGVDAPGSSNATGIGSVSDSASNAYEFADATSPGGTDGWPAGGIYYAKNAAALASGSTITLDWLGSSAPVAKAISAFYCTGIDTTAPLDVIGVAAGTSTTPSVSTSATTTQADALTVGIVATEGSSGDTFTQDSSPAYGTPPARVGTTGGSATSNITLSGGYFIESATGVKTYDPTLGTSRDWAAVIVTFKGAATSTPVSGSDTLTPSITESTQVSALIAGSETLTPSITESQSSLVSSDRADTATPSLTESLDLLGIADTTEALTPSVTDLAQVAVLLDAADTMTPSLAETASVLISAARKHFLSMIGCGT
jgi:hypothetical protein